MFRPRRLKETNPMCMLVLWGWEKQAPIYFGVIRSRESKPGWNFFRTRRPNETNPIRMLVLWGCAKWAPIIFWEIRPMESTSRSKFVWVNKAKRNKLYMYECAAWLRNMSQKNLEILGRRKVSPGIFFCVSRRPWQTNPICM